MEGEQLTGKRDAAVIEHRTGKDWALKIRQMLDERHSGAIKARLVMDNLNIHSIASLYETFEPMEAGDPAKRPDIRYKRKHGTWANMTEIEPNVLKEQYLDCLIPNAVPMQTQNSCRGEKQK